jgi:DNA repair protein RadA/Sms
MAKSRTQYICTECGAEFAQWWGKCTNCNSVGSLIEQMVTDIPEHPTRPSLNWSSNNWMKGDGQGPGKSEGHPRSSFKLSQIADAAVSRNESGFSELDRVLGGGIVPGSLVLIGGEPGIGKSTLLMQVANSISYQKRVLYVSGEESGVQVKLRAQRLQVPATLKDQSANNAQQDSQVDSQQLTNQYKMLPPTQEEPATDPQEAVPDASEQSSQLPETQFYLLPETDLEEILRELESLKPYLAIIDSIQTIYFPSLTSAPGSVAQVRECTSALLQVAKRENITLFIVGHVTKEGGIAGPRVLEHLVDTVLFFEGDRFASHRLLRSMKNRFGATHEIGVFEMVAHGLQEITNPSELFLSSREETVTGSAIVVALEGTRPIVVELQALVSPSSYGSPRRSTTGMESNRLVQILAVLEKRVGVPLSKLDTYVASVGGLQVSEPAADLGVAIAIVSSFRDRVVDPHTVLIGEVGLGGQVRPVSQLELRLREAAKLGFKRAIVPKGQIPPDLDIEIVSVGKVLDAILEAIPGPANPSANDFSSATQNMVATIEGDEDQPDDFDDFDDFGSEPVF